MNEQYYCIAEVTEDRPKELIPCPINCAEYVGIDSYEEKLCEIEQLTQKLRMACEVLNFYGNQHHIKRILPWREKVDYIKQLNETGWLRVGVDRDDAENWVEAGGKAYDVLEKIGYVD